LSARGVEIEVDGSDLIVRGADRLTDTEIERLRGMKADLMALLRGSADVERHVEELRSYACPDDFLPWRWETIHDGAVRFATEWAAEAIRLGWVPEELFAFAEPFANISLHGAAWLIGDKTVTEVTAAAIGLRTPSGATQRIYRKTLQ
jgi:hypothetical protein